MKFGVLLFFFVIFQDRVLYRRMSILKQSRNPIVMISYLFICLLFTFVKMSSYPKKSRNVAERTARPLKRRFHGNQWSSRKDSSLDQSSASAKKLATADVNDVIRDPLLTYRIIEFFSVFNTLADILVCGECKQKIKFEESGNRGLGFKLVVVCHCGKRFIQSGPLVNTGYEINRRIVLVMRLLGVARDGINLFCNFMDMCNGISQHAYDNIIKHVHSASKSVFDSCCQKAVQEEKEENSKRERPLLNLKVSGDGSWKKRGFKSLYGVTTLIGYFTGKVIDLTVKSSFCKLCLEWKDKTNTEEFHEWFEFHEEQCTKNHEGSAGKMEVDSILEMFARSETKFGVRYGNYIGDGDSKTFKAVLDAMPYGNDFVVTKSECIGHVQKRMGSRLRNVKKAQKLGGKEKLTDTLIKKLSIYYCLAIQPHTITCVQRTKNLGMSIARKEHIVGVRGKKRKRQETQKFSNIQNL